MSWFLGVKSIYERQKNQCMVVWIMHLSWGNGRGRELQQGLNWTMSPGDLSMMGWPLPYFGNYIAFLSQKIPQIICQDQSDSEDYTCGPVLLHPCTDALFFKSVSSNVSSDLLLQIHQQGGWGGSSPKLSSRSRQLFMWSFFFEPVTSNVSWNASSSNVKGSWLLRLDSFS